MHEIKPRGVYAAHRENQRERILEVAQDLFIRKGIELVTLADIAKGARLTRATVYEYFANKQEIAWAIFESIARAWRQALEQNIGTYAGSGYEKLERFLLNNVDHAIGDPRESSFVAQFNYLYAKEGSPRRMIEAFQQAPGDSGRFMSDIIRQGIADGSLRPDLNPEMAASAVFNFVASLNLRLGLLGSMVEAEYGQSTERIFHVIVHIFLDGIRVQPVLPSS